MSSPASPPFKVECNQSEEVCMSKSFYSAVTSTIVKKRKKTSWITESFYRDRCLNAVQEHQHLNSSSRKSGDDALELYFHFPWNTFPMNTCESCPKRDGKSAIKRVESLSFFEIYSSYRSAEVLSSGFLLTFYFRSCWFRELSFAVQLHGCLFIYFRKTSI